MKNIKILMSEPKGLEELYKNGGFSHKTGNSIKLTPFKTTPPKDIIEDLMSFQGVVGECFRLSTEKEFGKSFQKNVESSFNTNFKNHILENLIKKVQTNKPEELLDIVNNLFFEENNSLLKFNKKMLPFMNFHNDEQRVKDVSLFFYDIFLNAGILKNGELSTSGNNNIFYQLLEDCLPVLEKRKVSKKTIQYSNIFVEITKLFEEDLMFIALNEESFLKSIEDLFKYYYFFYNTQLAYRFSTFGESDELKKVFFSMDWETLSGTRLAYNFGWKTLEYDISKIFAHVFTIELLNYITIDDERLGDYNSITLKWDTLLDIEKDELISKISALSDFYKPLVETYKKPFNIGEGWGKCETQLSEKLLSKQFDSRLTREIYCLFYRVNYQFENSGRKKPYSDYSDNLKTFCKINYTKTRGRLGVTTVLNHEALLFFTKLCVGTEDKIRLNRLWGKLEQRGLTFDEKSKDEIIKLYERINLLEKKSDSGDAQYVKSII
jgi:DNA phosphorothioation-dependent restriction protein DptG